MELEEDTQYRREFKLAAIDERLKAQIVGRTGIRVYQLRKWRLEFEQEEQA